MFIRLADALTSRYRDMDRKSPSYIHNFVSTLDLWYYDGFLVFSSRLVQR